ncbi:hypothetical protein [Aquisphaera insulae]|uniref:hypothetical protein n=1 Tax=Aquisphaera insulae TaxID=2712864 RepID=UPI0013E9C556|nr:hypothetical protein [Aquisphaera insulae]
MSAAEVRLEAGGLLPAGSKVDADATEQVVARSYRHPALRDRPVVRLTSDRLGEAEDLAMEFLGFEAPAVSPPVAVQRRRSLGFAAWALINDPANARYALDLVKRMKAAARQARSKPGHAWDAYTEMARDLGRSVRHFLPPFWEEAGRTFKDLSNATYAGRALNKSLEAERVHALPADRARRRDVILEFVLSGCLAANALSDYGDDLVAQYPPEEAFTIFRDLCVRRTRGGMAPWASLPKDFTKLARAAGLKPDQELERWLEEIIDAPAMARPPLMFWKSCSAHCKRIVARNPAFAVALLRHTRPEERYYGESTLGPWFDLIEEWGVLGFLPEDTHRGAPPLGEPVADWFGRIVRDDVPAPARTFQLLEKLAPRLRAEAVPVPLSKQRRYRSTEIDVDVLEACLVLEVPVADPPPECIVTFAGWLSAKPDHRLRNQDIVRSAEDRRFRPAVLLALAKALTCRGGPLQRGYRQWGIEQRPFPQAASDRPGIKSLWHGHTSGVLSQLEWSGLASFEDARQLLKSTLWPETLRLFPDIAERMGRIDAAAMLERTLRAGVFDEYGLPALEEVVHRHQIKVPSKSTTIQATFPRIVIADGLYAHVVAGDGTVTSREIRLPKKSELTALVPIGDDLAVFYRDDKHKNHLFWTSHPDQDHEPSAGWYQFQKPHAATVLDDGDVFLGHWAVRPGDKQTPLGRPYFHDGTRFWSVNPEYDQTLGDNRWRVTEINPRNGVHERESVPPWFEETEGGTMEFPASELLPAPAGSESSPLGVKDGLLGWKAVKRRDGGYFGVGIDGRRWDEPLLDHEGSAEIPLALLRQPGTDRFLPVTASDGRGEGLRLWAPDGSTAVADLTAAHRRFARGQVAILPLLFWHFLKVRDEASSRKLRAVSHDECEGLLKAAAEDHRAARAVPRVPGKLPPETPLTTLLPAVKAWLPSAPERLAIGVARVVEQAEQEAAAFARLREMMLADPTKSTAEAATIDHGRNDLATAYWGLRQTPYYVHHGAGLLSEHLHAVATFLKDERQAGDLPKAEPTWFEMLEHLPLRCWQTYWRIQSADASRKDGGKTPWLEFLKLWHDLGIARLPGRFALMQGVAADATPQSWGGYVAGVPDGTALAIRHGDDRFIFVASRSYYPSEQLPYLILRYSTAPSPGEPPGYRVQDLRTLEVKEDPAEIEAFLAAAGACTCPPLPSREELQGLADRLAVSPAEVVLVWTGGLNLDSYEHHFLPAALRESLGLKAAEANAARQALRNLEPAVRETLYQAVVAAGCAAPFVDDRGPVLQLLEVAWRARTPRRLPLEAALQTRLAALGKLSRWRPAENGEILAAAADPAHHPALKPRDFRIDVEKTGDRSDLKLAAKKDEAIVTDAFLRSVVHLVALIHAETPAGHPARGSMPDLIRKATALLDHPGTLLEFRRVHLYGSDRKKPPTPAEWLGKHVGKTSADAKAGIIRVDDCLVAAGALEGQITALLAFRPEALRDHGDLARLVGILGVEVTDGYVQNTDVIPIVVAIRSPGFQKLAKAILAEDMAPGAWPQNPAVTAPDVVRQIQQKHKLGDDAATLYAQLLALPEPTTANVGTWNAWNSARCKKAAAEVVGRGLALEATRARAGRSTFLPGEWVELKAPWLPIERWKLAHLVEIDMTPHDPCPAGGPLVLRPFEDLFAAAWARVRDGDEPRYEEAKRKRKAK